MRRPINQQSITNQSSIINHESSLRHVRDQRDLTSALDCRLQLALVQRAGARDPPRQELAALGDERTDQLDDLVVDVVDLVRAELADLAPAEQRAALALFLLRGLLVAAASAAAAARASLSEWHLGLPPVETVVFGFVHVAGVPAFARLPLWWQAALHAAPLRFGAALGLRPLDDL